MEITESEQGKTFSIFLSMNGISQLISKGHFILKEPHILLNFLKYNYQSRSEYGSNNCIVYRVSFEYNDRSVLNEVL